MFNVLIVDDEPIIRKGLVNVIEWNKLDCQVCGEACDGIRGIEMIKEKIPDIIMVDINMPGIDGLTMIKETKDLIPHSKIIILTGYRDFEYIQQAIKLGAFDYILKPSKIDEIMNILKKAVAQLNNTKKNNEEALKLKESFEKAIPVLKEKFLYDVMFKVNMDDDEIKYNCMLYNIKIENFIMILLQLKFESNPKEMDIAEDTSNCFGIIYMFEQTLLDDFLLYKISLNNTRFAFIVQPKECNKNFEQELFKQLRSFENFIKTYFEGKIDIFISTMGNGIKELYDKMNECICGDDYLSLKINSPSKVINSVIKDDSLPDTNKKNINLVLEKAISFLNNHYSENITLSDVAAYTYVSSYYLSRMFKKELNKHFVDYLNEIRIEKAKEYLKDIKYKTYEISDMVGIQDAHYFSKLFKKYTGMKPTEYRDLPHIHEGNS